MTKTNKRILYIGPVYFSYDQILIKKIRHAGYEVDPFELHIRSLRYKFTAKFTPSKIENFKKNYYEKVFENRNYDFVLVRHGHQLPASFYQKLKEFNPNATFINFHWDSIKPQYDYQAVIHCFDKVYSFDYKDCQNNSKIEYLPLFFIDEYAEYDGNKSNAKFDLLFIGAWRNKERLALIELTEKFCTENRLKFHHYLYLSFQRHFWMIKDRTLPRKTKLKQLSHKQIIKLFSVSNTIIDFPSSFQTGLTMRTFETLGAGKKLITTNKNIITEPFYNPEFIRVIDTDNFTLDIDFIKRTPKTSMKDKMNEYSIESYIHKLLQE